MRPGALIGIAQAAIAPFYDATLQERQDATCAAWKADADKRLSEIDKATLKPFGREMRKIAKRLQPSAAKFNAQADAFETEAKKITVEFPPFEPAEPTVADHRPSPLVSTDMPALDFIDMLRARRITTKSEPS